MSPPAERDVIPRSVQRAARSGQPVRVYLRDGEVLVARILDCDTTVFRYAVETSTRPERYGVCDSTGFERALAEVERITLLQDLPR